VIGRDAAVAIARPDAAGRLRVVWQDGRTSDRDVDRARRRRAAYRDRHASLVPIGHERALAIVPLASASTVQGTLEVEAGASALASARDVIHLLSGQLATTLQTAQEFDRLRARMREQEAEAAERRERLDMGLAWTAHELRGPLMGVRAALESMTFRAESTERSVMRASMRELEHLMGTTEALLTWAAGTRAVEREPQDLLGLVREAITTIALESGVEARITRAPADATVDVDATHLRTALVNLLRNAAAHADAGTTVEVDLAREDGRLVISVTNQGPSIPAEERMTIFDPFVRGSARTRGGSGLGLFITRRIVEAHDGRIWVEGGERSTTFRFALPTETWEVQRSAS
jgi:signal transduction histidine kinase